MSTFKERLAAARLPERSVQVCLRGDLVAQFDDLERKLKEARSSSTTRNSGAALEIVEQQNALRAEMAEAMLTITVRALPRGRWNEARLNHPPEDGDEGDRVLGVKLDEFMGEVMPLCVVEPEMDADDWDRLNEVLSAGDFDRLVTAVWDVNRSGVDIPKSRLASLVTAESDAASR